MENKKVIVILGPTASGKSDVAIRLAKKFGGEIISADSRQIYRGMDIGSGKVEADRLAEIPKEFSDRKFYSGSTLYISDGIPHHLIDVADPNDDFNISHFKKLADKAIADILNRGKVPIICGGTGFWIKSIIDNTQLPEVKPDQLLRSMLRNKPAEELFAMLKKLDPERAETIDAKNSVRLIRAIEICRAIGKVPKIRNQELEIRNQEFLQIGLDIEKDILNKKIKKRLDQRFAQGMIEEVEKLHKNGVTWERLEYFGLEYRWIAKYLQKKISLEDMQEKLYFDIIHYAKRQMTWFNKDKRIIWLKDYTEIEKALKEFLLD